MISLREDIAKAIYSREGGLWPEEHEKVVGREQTPWLKLEEWQRDEYRAQSDAVIEVLRARGIIGLA